MVGVAAAVVAMFIGSVAQAASVLVVGPGHQYAKPCQAIAAASAGDTIQIDAAGNGTYNGDVCAWTTAGLTIEGINGRAHIDAAGLNAQGKGIWVISGADTVIRNVELSGATVPVDNNGAAIRLQGSGDLTLSSSSLHDNQEGILANGSATDTDVVVDSSEFANNGFGDGLTHNIYVSSAHSFTMRYSYSHDANQGHLVKSRALTNNILYNRLTGQTAPTAYELDLPQGGLSHVIGNVIEQSQTTTNSTMLAYAEESSANASQQLFAINNTFVNDRSSGGIAIHLGAGAAPATVANNIVAGPGTFVDQVGATLTHNCQSADPGFVAPASLDYHLTAGSPCRDAGTTVSPAATEQYVYDLGHEARPVIGAAPDAGAFEFVPDTDGDGLIDTHDACPTQSDLGAPQSPRTGCPQPPKPRDTDGDGIPDVSDACPTQSDLGAPQSPRTGCPQPPKPRDTDGDGIPDVSDACPSRSDAAARRTPRNGCPASVNFLTNGTPRRDILVGDSGRNEICGQLGNDRLNGAGGDDTLFGDACNVRSNGGHKDGNDTLIGAGGDDSLYGEGGNDSLDGGPGNDKLFGGAGNDKLIGGPGTDILTGGPGVNSYNGGPGDDVINARNGRKDSIDCGPGKHDLAIVDHADKVKNCEQVKRSKH